MTYLNDMYMLQTIFALDVFVLYVKYLHLVHILNTWQCSVNGIKTTANLKYETGYTIVGISCWYEHTLATVARGPQDVTAICPLNTSVARHQMQTPTM